MNALLAMSAPFASPQAPKSSARRGMAASKPSPRKQKLQLSSAKRATASLIPDTLVPSSSHERDFPAGVANPATVLQGVKEKYSIDVASLLDDIEARDVRPYPTRSPLQREPTNDVLKTERDTNQVRTDHLEHSNRTLRASLLEQMKRRKNEEEAFVKTLVAEKSKSNKVIARLHLKLDKREKLLATWAQLCHAVLTQTASQPAAMYEQLFEATNSCLGGKLDSLGIMTQRTQKLRKKRVKRAKQQRLTSSTEEDTDYGADSPRPAHPSVVVEGDEEDEAEAGGAAGNEEEEGEGEEGQEGEGEAEGEEFVEHGSAGGELLGLGGPLLAAHEPVMWYGIDESRPSSSRPMSSLSPSALQEMRNDDEEDMRVRLERVERKLFEAPATSSRDVLHSIDDLNLHLLVNNQAISDMVVKDQLEREAADALGGSEAGARAAAAAADADTTDAAAADVQAMRSPAEARRAEKVQDVIKSIAPEDFTYDQLLQEVLNSLSSAASSSVALDETLDMSSSIGRTDLAITEILSRKPMQSSSGKVVIGGGGSGKFGSQDDLAALYTESAKLRLGGALDGDLSFSLEGSLM